MPEARPVARNLPPVERTPMSNAPLKRQVAMALLVGGIAGPGCRHAQVPSCGSAARRAGAAAPAWRDEPGGLPLLSDEPFDKLDENGWHMTRRESKGGSSVSLSTDSGAPVSPPGVLQFTYGIGFPGGYAPGVEAFDPHPPVREAFFGLWWKPSDPWQNHAGSDVNKIAFLYPGEGLGDVALIMFKAGPGYTLQVLPEFSTTGDVRRLEPNLTATPVALGAWHQIEWYVKYASGDSSRDGVTAWWLDGIPQGRYTDLRTPPGPGFIEFQIAPTWGGMEGQKNEVDWYCFDQARVSGR